MPDTVDEFVTGQARLHMSEDGHRGDSKRGTDRCNERKRQEQEKCASSAGQPIKVVTRSGAEVFKVWPPQISIAATLTLSAVLYFCGYQHW